MKILCFVYNCHIIYSIETRCCRRRRRSVYAERSAAEHIHASTPRSNSVNALAHERKMKEKYAIFDGDECATRHHSSNVRARRRSPMIISVCKCVWHSIYSMHLLHDMQCSLHPIFIFLLLHFRMRACVRVGGDENDVRSIHLWRFISVEQWAKWFDQFGTRAENELVQRVRTHSGSGDRINGMTHAQASAPLFSLI